MERCNYLSIPGDVQRQRVAILSVKKDIMSRRGQIINRLFVLMSITVSLCKYALYTLLACTCSFDSYVECCAKRQMKCP